MNRQTLRAALNAEAETRLLDDPMRDYRVPLRDEDARSLRWFVLAILLAIVFLLGFATGSAFAEPCVVSIAFDPPVARIQQPLNVNDYQVDVRINPHPEHRLLVLSWDGGDAGAGSSYRKLQGRGDAIAHTFKIRGQPSANWTYVAAIYDDRGKRVGMRSIETILARAESSHAAR